MQEQVHTHTVRCVTHSCNNGCIIRGEWHILGCVWNHDRGQNLSSPSLPLPEGATLRTAGRQITAPLRELSTHCSAAGQDRAPSERKPCFQINLSFPCSQPFLLPTTEKCPSYRVISVHNRLLKHHFGKTSETIRLCRKNISFINFPINCTCFKIFQS